MRMVLQHGAVGRVRALLWRTPIGPRALRGREHDHLWRLDSVPDGLDVESLRAQLVGVVRRNDVCVRILQSGRVNQCARPTRYLAPVGPGLPPSGSMVTASAAGA